MNFQYNGKEYNYPASLSEITLQQRIDFHNTHGTKFEEDMKAVVAIENETLRAIQDTELRLLHGVKSFSFFTGIPVEEVKEHFALDQVMNVYNTSLAMLLEEEGKIELKESYDFKSKEWFIAAPAVTPQAKFTFNEFLVSKEVVRQLEQVGQGRWEALVYLCAIYLRQKDEEFDESFIADGSERMALMRELPLDVAMAVGFFLTSTMNTYLSTLQSSKEAEEKAQT